MDSRCAIHIGSLVSHPCGRVTGHRCPQCERYACKRHREDDGRCQECAGTYLAPDAPIRVTWDEMFAFSDEDAAAFDSRYEGPGRGLHDYDS